MNRTDRVRRLATWAMKKAIGKAIRPAVRPGVRRSTISSAPGLNGLERGHPLVVRNAGLAAAVAAVCLGCLPEADRVVERLVVDAVQLAEVLHAIGAVGLVELGAGL